MKKSLQLLLVLLAVVPHTFAAFGQMVSNFRAIPPNEHRQSGPRLRKPVEDLTIPWGGHHEFGLQAGFSPASGPLWGYSQDVQYMPLVLRYSWQFAGGRKVGFRYAPELTVLSRMHETTPNDVNLAQQMTTTGSGATPVAFQFVFRPRKRVQPYLNAAGGFVYFKQRVLSPQGSQYMYTVDFGTGANIFLTKRLAIQTGFKYQHLSNANISYHNPGTDAETYYLGFSYFHTHGVW